MYQADLLCCLCEQRGDHIHHIDNDHTNHATENLVLVCFKHHSELTAKGGLSRKISANLLRKYRNTLYKKVEVKRRLPSMRSVSKNSSRVSGDLLFQTVLDALSVRELQKLRARASRDEDENKIIGTIYEAASYLDSSGLRVREAVLMFLDDIASDARSGMSDQIARALARATYDALPIRTLRIQSKARISKAERNLIEYGVAIGVALAYDGALYLQDINVVDAGGQLLWKILRYARINKLAALQQLALGEFDTAEDAAVRGGNDDISALLRLYREHGLKGDWRYPAYGKRLLRKLA